MNNGIGSNQGQTSGNKECYWESNKLWMFQRKYACGRGNFFSCLEAKS